MADLDLTTVELNIHGGKIIGTDDFADKWSVRAIVADWADEHAGETVARLAFVSLPFYECNPWEECDKDSGDLETVASALWDADGEWRAEFLDRYEEATWSGERTLILDTAQVEDQFRGQGVGAIIVGHAIKQLRAGVNFVACYPYPIDKDRGDESPEGQAQNAAAAAKIAKVYESIGFEPWEGGVWILDASTSRVLDERLRELAPETFGD